MKIKTAEQNGFQKEAMPQITFKNKKMKCFFNSKYIQLTMHFVLKY